VQGRFIGAALLNNAWQGTTVAGTNNPFVDNNNVRPVAYLDLRGSYKWTDNIQFYGAVDNFTNVPAPSVAGSASASSNPWQTFTTIPSVYDALGRAYRVGVRVNY
jgi:outer membrane receptor protein involved in Fe transport